MSMLEIGNMALGLSAWIISLVLLIVAGQAGNLRERVYRWFFITAAVNLLIISNEIVIYFLQGHAGQPFTTWIRILDFGSYINDTLGQLAFAAYLYWYISTKVKVGSAYMRAIAILSGCALMLAVVAQFNHMYVVFDEQNHYIEQQTAWISSIFPALSMVTHIVVTLRHKKCFTPRQWISLILYALMPLFCFVVESGIEGLWLYPMGGTFSLLLIFVNIQVELRHQYQLQQTELANNRVAMLLSQIQPHFLYNTLSSIAKLCYNNKEAYEALMTFAQYMRSNMRSMTQTALIPFERELEHVRQYLMLEKLRFEEKLNIVYDIRADQFDVPVLTLQPIVENAVRHGVSLEPNGGTVTIRTRESTSDHLIDVIDNGAGFNPADAWDAEAHLGINNVRDRLAAMCAGQLFIESTAGRGTKVTIQIPKGGANHDHRRR